MGTYLIRLSDLDRTMSALAGGKGANLGELTTIEGIQVPDGFCVTTDAYRKITANPDLTRLLEELTGLTPEARDSIRAISAKIRSVIENSPIPDIIANEITTNLATFSAQHNSTNLAAFSAQHSPTPGAQTAFAVRSSATAEDLPDASFAGQQDTYLNITGNTAILQHISKCWASLYSDRAVIYRIQKKVDHRQVHLAVIIQQMLFPQASGVLFTADPVTSNRKLLSIDAVSGLGEALVSGRVTPDNYQVRGGRDIVARRIATKQQTPTQQLPHTQVLTDPQIIRLAAIGRQIEVHFGRPQDIEWCLMNDNFYIVQSRPITTLYPIPESDDQEKHVYLSVAHQQMMTDPMRPLGLSLWQLNAFRPMFKAGGRLFVDITPQLSSPAARAALIDAMGQHDPLIKDALISLSGTAGQPVSTSSAPVPPADIDPAIVAGLIARSQLAVEALQRDIESKSGPELFDFILEDIGKLKQLLADPNNMAVIMTAINASNWINRNIQDWLGETNVADTLSQSAPNNITSQMGLALLDVADAIRPWPEVVDYLHHIKEDNFFDGFAQLRGGQQSADAIRAWLDKFGMRCVGEIDITRTRWSEKPSMLIPIILSHIVNFEPNAGSLKFDRGLREASGKEQELLARLAALPDGEAKAKETKRVIGVLRDSIGYREYPKYSIISRLFPYKQALLDTAEQLLQAGVIRQKEDIYYLTFDELHDVVSTQHLDHGIIDKRKAELRIFEQLTPPRVITSDGEIIAGKYRRDNLPSNAMAGLAVSSGIAEGRARVIFNMEDANPGEDDILVTTFTDPSWTPLFVSIKGLVTEVGGLMTHGAVIAREYGLPAVVGVENATRLIKDGQPIRVNGTEGYVEILG